MKVKAYLKRVDGRIERLAGDEQDARQIPQGFKKASTAPGGWTSCSFALSRDAMRRDLDPYDELVVHGDGNRVLFEGYGIEYPASDGDDAVVNVQATGWGSCLKDNPCPPVVGVDRSSANWSEASIGRQTSMVPFMSTYNTSISPSNEGGLFFLGSSGETVPQFAYAELIYNGAVALSKIMYAGTQINTSGIDTAQIAGANDALLTSGYIPNNLTLNGVIQTLTFAAKRYLQFWARANAPTTPGAGAAFNRGLTTIAVYGDHGIPLTPMAGDTDGILPSDMLAWLLRKTCPMLNVRTGVGGIEASAFVIPHLVLVDVDSVEDAVLQINRFDIADWGIYENRTPFLRAHGTGRTFVARTDDNGVSYDDAGLTGDDLFTGVIATYTDPTGRSLSVGPPGSGCDSEVSALANSTPNSLTRHGRTRVGKISISTTAVERDVIQTASRWLDEKNLIETRGEVTVGGFIRDLAGNPAHVSEIRAMDQIILSDREWKPRRIVEENYDGDSDKSSLSLDGMPTKVDAMMERLGVYNEAENV